MFFYALWVSEHNRYYTSLLLLKQSASFFSSRTMDHIFINQKMSGTLIASFVLMAIGGRLPITTFFDY